MLDDTSVTSEARPGVTNVVPNPDAIQEVRVVANNFSAVDGRDTGAQIRMITKAGTNQFHGTLHFYNQNNALAARNEFEAATPVFRRNLFGGTFGGPLIRNRTFFFLSYEGLRQPGGRAQVAVVETPQLRNYVNQTRPNSIAALFFNTFQPIVNPTSNIRDVGRPGAGPNAIGPPDGILTSEVRASSPGISAMETSGVYASTTSCARAKTGSMEQPFERGITPSAAPSAQPSICLSTNLPNM